MTAVMPEIDTEDLTILVPYEDSDDPNRRTHIVSPPENLHITNGDPKMLAQDVVDIARVIGQEVVALCGYKWVPKHNPDKFDACEACMTIAGHIMRGLGE